MIATTTAWTSLNLTFNIMYLESVMQNKIYNFDKRQQIKLKPNLKDEVKTDIGFVVATVLMQIRISLLCCVVLYVFCIFHCCCQLNAGVGLVGRCR